MLPDNVELVRRADTEPAGKGQGQRQLRRISNLTTWVQCYASYAAIVADAHPLRVRDLFAYLRLIVREAQRHAGEGWRAYDVVFRKLAATYPTIPRGQPLPSLYSTSFTAAGSPAITFCEHCLEGDHRSGECALSPSNEVGSFSQERLVLLGSNAASLRRGAGKSTAARPPGPGFADRPICKRWNFSASGCKGYPGCTFRHACLRCGKRNHKVVECREVSAAAGGKEQDFSTLSSDTSGTRRA